MKTKLFLLFVCLFGLFLGFKGSSLEAREHRHHHRSKTSVQLNVGAECGAQRCDRYVVRRYAAPAYIPQRVYVPARPVIYQPVYVYSEPAPCIAEEVYVQPARPVIRPSLFSGLSFTWNFR